MNNFKLLSSFIEREFDSIQKCQTETVENSSCRTRIDSSSRESNPNNAFGGTSRIEHPRETAVSAFEEDRVRVAEESSRRTSLVQHIYRDSVEPAERCSYRMSIELKESINEGNCRLRYDQLGHFRTVKSVDNAISRLEALRLIGSSGQLNVVEIMLVLIVLGYFQWRQEAMLQDVSLVEEMMGIYCEAGQSTMDSTKLVAFLCLLEGNDTENCQFYAVPGKTLKSSTRSTPTLGEKQRAPQRFEHFRANHQRFLRKQFRPPTNLSNLNKRLWNFLKKGYQESPQSKTPEELRDCYGQRLFRLSIRRK